MKMIKVINHNGEEVYVNIERIASIMKYEYLNGHTRIDLTHNLCIVAKGTPEQIVAMIHETEGNK